MEIVSQAMIFSYSLVGGSDEDTAEVDQFKFVRMSFYSLVQSCGFLPLFVIIGTIAYNISYK